MEAKNQLPYLPHDLITRILLRLPVKSLMRFKCVCKSWFSLISSDTHFANSHGHRVLFISTSTHETRSVDLESSLDDDTASVSLNPINFIPSEPYSFIDIKGSCRGFILLLCHPTFYIWNPSTGFHKNIPLSPLGLNLDTVYFYGFGYDQSTDDYLIVLMSSHTNSSYLELFSLRANTWKQIDEGTNFHYLNAIPTYNGKPGSLFNGVIHWLAYRRELLEDVIVTFDLMEKKLLVIHLPDQFDLEIDYYSDLWEFREYLSLSALNHENNTVEIWVMKEYRVHSSWTKTHVLSVDALPAKYFSPLSCTKIGDIVGTNGHFRLAKYNDVGQLLGHRYYTNHPHGCSVVMYSESLLSLPEINVQA